jgi:hypothetical protein
LGLRDLAVAEREIVQVFMAFIEEKYKVPGKWTIPFQRVYILAKQDYANDVQKGTKGCF